MPIYFTTLKFIAMSTQESSYYKNYLFNYIRESHPELLLNITFINERVALAEERFEESRRAGLTVEGAQEIAIASLTKGLHFSKYDTIIEVIWNEFDEIIPSSDAPRIALAILLLSEVEPIFANYIFDDDFGSRREYDDFYSDITGFIVMLLEKYGV